MVTSKKFAKGATNPIVWALAIVLVMVAGGYTYTIVSRCQTSTFEAIKLMTISLGKCEAPPPPVTDKPPAPTPAMPPEPVKVVRSEMPCRWAWIWLGKYSTGAGKYVLPPAFKFDEKRGPGSPFPTAGDRIVLTADRTLLITDYMDAPSSAKCAKILSPPWGYSPATASKYVAGVLKKNVEVAVNQVVLMPEASAEPTYVWALVGPEQ